MVAGTQVWPGKGTRRTRVPGALDTRPQYVHARDPRTARRPSGSRTGFAREAWATVPTREASLQRFSLAG